MEIPTLDIVCPWYTHMGSYSIFNNFQNDAQLLYYKYIDKLKWAEYIYYLILKPCTQFKWYFKLSVAEYPAKREG